MAEEQTSVTFESQKFATGAEAIECARTQSRKVRQTLIVIESKHADNPDHSFYVEVDGGMVRSWERIVASFSRGIEDK